MHRPGTLVSAQPLGVAPAAVVGVTCCELSSITPSDYRFAGTREGTAGMSENLRLLGKYSAAMESGDGEAVYEFFAENFHSHVT
jgi:hypothetical protein